MAILGLEIVRLTPENLDADERVAEEAKKILTSSAAQTRTERSQDTSRLGSLLHTQSQFEHVKSLARDDPSLLKKISYRWTTSSKFETSFGQQALAESEKGLSESEKKQRERERERLETILRPGRPKRGSVLLARSEDEEGPGAFNVVSSFLDRRDEEIASIRMVQGDTTVPLILDGGAELNFFSDFLLQAVSEPRQEKYQIVETFGRAFLYMYGARQEVFSFQGILLDFKNFDWKNRFTQLYRNQMRGSVAIRNGQQIEITYRGCVRTGQLLNLNINHNVGSLNHVTFSFQMFIEDQTNLPAVSDISATEAAELTGLTEAEVKNDILVVAPDVPFTVVNQIRDQVFTRNNEIRSGMASGIWTSPNTKEAA